MTLKVAIVSRDAAVRDAAARAFAGAPPGWQVTLCSDEPEQADVVVRGPGAGGEGGIVFDPERPDDALEAVTRATEAGRVYVVAAATGGAGATSIALHVAAELRGCYAELAEPSERLGLPDDARTWLPPDEDPALSALPVAGGFRVLRAPRPCPAPSAFPLERARASFSHLVLDVGTRRDLDEIAEVATVNVLVTSPTRPGALAARSLMADFPGARWAVVVNRSGPGGQLMRTALESLLGSTIALELPCCPALRDAEDEARLLTGRWRRWTGGIARLVRALEAC